MESLALLVGILFLCALSGGPISYLLTRMSINQSNDRKYKVARALRAGFVLFFALIGIVAGVGITINATPFFIKLITATGAIIAMNSLKRQFIDGSNNKEHN